MKLAFYHNHPSGGASRALYELGRRLARRHDIDVYTLSTGDETFLGSRHYARSLDAEPYAQRAPVRMALYLNDWRRYLDLRDLERVCRTVAARIDDGGYDAVLVNPCRFLQAPSVLHFLASPGTYYCHEPPRRFTQPECSPQAGPLSRYQRLRTLWHAPAEALLGARIAGLDRRNVAAAGQVLTNSRFTAGGIRSYYQQEAAVCYLGVDADAFRPDGASSGEYVLSVGAVEYHKGFDFLVRALAVFPRELRPDLVIVANYANPGVRAHLERLAQALAVRLQIREALSQKELVRAYQGARVFLYAPHQEPFGLAPLEAMACGIPVVAVAEGGVTESVVDGQTGLLVPRSEQVFAEALARLLENPGRGRSMGQEGRGMTERMWTWDAASTRLEAVLEDARAGVEVAAS